MSVYRVRFRDGKKILIPVKNKREYFSLRDSKFNYDVLQKVRNGETFIGKDGKQKSYKTLLEQFNYSCYPNEDGTLAKTATPSDSVGMDIDFKAPEQLPEGVTQE